MNAPALVSTFKDPPPLLFALNPAAVSPVPAEIVPAALTVTVRLPVPASLTSIASPAPADRKVFPNATSIETDKLLAVAFDAETPSSCPVTFSFISKVTLPPLVRAR